MSLKKDLIQLLKPYYLVNVVLSLSYVVLKRLPRVCNYLFEVEECEFEGVSEVRLPLPSLIVIQLFQRETEILFFLLIVIMIRTRKTGSVTMINYLSSSFIYTKIANLILWFYADYRMGLIYGVIFVRK